MVDSVYRTRSLGVAAEGIPDQYADGKAARVWEIYIGSKQSRTDQYRNWIVSLLTDRGCKNILDVACGTGVDSIMLLEQGFNVTSTDASDKMLKYALKERWIRRKEEAFDKWIIEEGNWLTLVDDLANLEGIPSNGFDAVICLGNSFAHMPDFAGDLSHQKTALKNFMNLVRPGGVLVIDHRNYDEILATGQVPAKNVYYNGQNIKSIKCSNLYVNGKPTLVTMDYLLEIPPQQQQQQQQQRTSLVKQEGQSSEIMEQHHFRLSYYPHRLQEFTAMLKEMFGKNAQHTIFGDFKPLGKIKAPAYYIHVVQKK
jgi:glycine N-methyltransferase